MKTKLSLGHASLSLSLQPSPRFGLMLATDDLAPSLREEVSHRFQLWEAESHQELEITFCRRIAILEQSLNDLFRDSIS